jgi:beta-galactosidase
VLEVDPIATAGQGVVVLKTHWVVEQSLFYFPVPYVPLKQVRRGVAAVVPMWIFIVAIGMLMSGAPRALAADTSQVRTRQSLNAGWLFERQVYGSGELGSFDRRTEGADKVEPQFRDASMPGYDDSRWNRIELPHTWNAYDDMDSQAGYWRGIGWYRKHFRVNSKFAGKRIVLQFEGVNQAAKLWLNGKYLGIHKGGYTGFSFEITPLFGADNVLTVEVSNLYDAAVPPTVKTDLDFYGGIYRSVWLEITGTTYISDMDWTTPHVSAATAQTDFRSRVINQSRRALQLTLTQQILDPKGIQVGSVVTPLTIGAGDTKTLTQSVGALDSPQLWSPETPNLYHIRTSLSDGSRLLDMRETPLGYRWYRFDPQQGFFLNGKRVQIRGTNLHQSYPGMGSAVPTSRSIKDMEMVHDMGVNFWRTSHYPHDEATMDASDRLGLMVWEELPIMKEIGNPNEYIANVSNMAREMIHRDRNHPSVVVWGIAGEVNAPTNISVRVVGAVSTLYRSLDPTRPVAMHSPRGDDISSLVDVVGEEVSPETDQEHVQHAGRAYMTAEYSVDLIGRGLYGGGLYSEEHGLERHEDYLRELNQRPWMAGGCIWNEFDYAGETYDPIIPHVVSFGMTDIWRIPKEVYYLYQSQWTTRPMVHIVGHWTGEEGKIRTVTVLSNQDEVELFLNGKSLGLKKNISGTGLRYPPRIWQFAYQPGTLEAIAKNGGIEIRNEQRTAGAAYRILLKSDIQTIVSGDPDSLAYITASVVDQSGEIVPDAHSPITFTWDGPGELMKQTWLGHGTGLTWNAIDGRTRVAFRSTERSGMAVISAYSPGLRTAQISIDVTAPGKPDEMNYIDLAAHDELPK